MSQNVSQKESSERADVVNEMGNDEGFRENQSILSSYHEAGQLSQVPGSSIQIVKRRRGAPKGNLNALKHGLYIEGSSIRNATPIERAQLNDFHSIITNFKHYMDSTYEQGLKAKTLADYNETLRTLSLGLMALSRAVTLQNAYMSSMLPSKLTDLENLTEQDLLAYYQKKLDVFSEDGPE